MTMNITEDVWAMHSMPANRFDTQAFKKLFAEYEQWHRHMDSVRRSIINVAMDRLLGKCEDVRDNAIRQIYSDILPK